MENCIPNKFAIIHFYREINSKRNIAKYNKTVVPLPLKWWPNSTWYEYENLD